MKFKYVSLNDVCKEIVDCPHKTPVWRDTGIPIIRNFNIKSGKLDTTKQFYVDENTYIERTKRAIPEYDDIIISREAPMGELCLIPKCFKCCLGQRLVLLKINKEICYPKYLLYIMLSEFVQKQIKIIDSTGSIVSNLNIPDLKALKIPLVDMKEQVKIGNLLSFLDGKIDFNNKINTELEKMAKTLYEYWFVQFDFPDENKRPYKSANGKMVYNNILKREIPEGWEVLKLENRFAFERGKEYGAQLYKDSKQTDNDIKFYRVGDMDGSGSTYIDKTTVDSCPMITKNDVVVSFDGSVGRIGFALNGTYSTGMRKIYDYESIIKSSTIYFIFNDNRIQATISKYASGSNILHASASIEHLNIPYNKNVYLSFQQKIEPIFNKMIDIVEENKKLIELRDFLLPLLMNGQVSVQN